MYLRSAGQLALPPPWVLGSGMQGTKADASHAATVDLALAKAIPRAALRVRRKLAILFRHLILMGRFKRKESVIPD